MKKQIFTLCLLSSSLLGVNAQSLLDDFENGITYTDKLATHIPADASCGVDENPKPDAVNDSEAVLMFLRKTDQNFWMGAYADLKEDKKLLSRNHTKLQLKYFRTTDKTTIRIKINGDDIIGEFDPVNAPTKINEWEVLEFDYGSRGYTEVYNLDLRPDWCNDGEVEKGRKTYIDDIIFIGEPKQFDGKIADFENNNVEGFFGVLNENITLSTVSNDSPNDINKSQTCLKVIKSEKGQNWEGVMKNGFKFEIGNNDNQFSYLHFDIKKPIVSSIGIVIKNDPGEDESSYIDNTKTNEWEHIVVDLSAHPGEKNTLFIQPELSGTNFDPIYLDNIYLSKSPIHTSTNIVNRELPFSVKVVNSKSVEITSKDKGLINLISISGSVLERKNINNSTEYFNNLSSGIYIIQYTSNNYKLSQKICIK